MFREGNYKGSSESLLKAKNHNGEHGSVSHKARIQGSCQKWRSKFSKLLNEYEFHIENRKWDRIFRQWEILVGKLHNSIPIDLDMKSRKIPMRNQAIKKKT